MAAPKERNGSPLSTLLLLITWKILDMGHFSENMGIIGNMGQVDSLSYMLVETEYEKDTF